MKWILLCLFLCAFTPLKPKHDTMEQVDEEFRNVEHSVQDKKFTIITTTPTLGTMRDGEFKILYSSGVTSILLRNGNDLYSVKVSCVTVWR